MLVGGPGEGEEEGAVGGELLGVEDGVAADDPEEAELLLGELVPAGEEGGDELDLAVLDAGHEDVLELVAELGLQQDVHADDPHELGAVHGEVPHRLRHALDAPVLVLQQPVQAVQVQRHVGDVLGARGDQEVAGEAVGVGIGGVQGVAA